MNGADHRDIYFIFGNMIESGVYLVKLYYSNQATKPYLFIF